MLDLASTSKLKHKSRNTLSDKENLLFKQLQKQFSNRSDDSLRGLLEAKLQQATPTQIETETLFRKAHFDALTHLPNRAYFNEVLEHFIVSSHKQEMAFALLFLDLDGFKAVNDEMGHQTGDELLRHVAARLMFAVREEDKVFRLGGDEFVILLPEITEHETTEKIAQRIIHEISQAYWLNGQPVHISTSIGIALFPKDGQIAADLIANADKALYAAKSKGKGIALFYEESYLTPQQKFAAEVADLEQAIEAAELTICSCQQYSLEHQSLELIHHSLCWQQQTLPTWEDKLESSRYATQIGNWLIDNSFYHLQQSSDQAKTRIAIPLILKLLKQTEITEKLSKALSQYQVQAQQVLLQLNASSWTQLMASSSHRDQIEQLNQKGFYFILEGMDEHQFVLNALQHPAVQIVQLNAEWVLQSKQDEKLDRVETLIQMLHLLNKKVSLDEGVLEPQLMRKLGIDWVKSIQIPK
ncbi:diguanylate cyclase domain-containing protein [Galenea microaerophila]